MMGKECRDVGKNELRAVSRSWIEFFFYEDKMLAWHIKKSLTNALWSRYIQFFFSIKNLCQIIFVYTSYNPQISLLVLTFIVSKKKYYDILDRPRGVKWPVFMIV